MKKDKIRELLVNYINILVREKSVFICDLLNDEEKLKEERQNYKEL